MSEASAAQYYYDPPDPREYTYAVTVSLDVTALTEDEAMNIVNKVMGQGPLTVNDWYIDEIHAYGPEVDEDHDGR